MLHCGHVSQAYLLEVMPAGNYCSVAAKASLRFRMRSVIVEMRESPVRMLRMPVTA